MLPATLAARKYVAYRSMGFSKAVRARWKATCAAELRLLGLDRVGEKARLTDAGLWAYLRDADAMATGVELLKELAASKQTVRSGSPESDEGDGSMTMTLGQAMVLKLEHWPGPAEVFGQPKYDECHAVVAATKADPTELTRLGLALQAAWWDFDAQLRKFLFNAGGGWDADRLRNPARHPGGRELLDVFIALQREEAGAMCALTARLSEQAFGKVKGAGKDGKLPPLAVDTPSTPTDVQPFPSVFRGMVFSGSVRFAELDAEAQSTITGALDLLIGHTPELTKGNRALCLNRASSVPVCGFINPLSTCVVQTWLTRPFDNTTCS